MYILNNRPGQQPFEGKRLRVVNRCGATALQVGDVVALDLDASDADTQALKGVGGVTLPSLTEAMFHNVVEVAAAPVNAIVCVVTSLLSGGGEDDTEVEVQVGGRVKAKVGGTNWSSARASCGVALMADTTGANRRLVAAADGANRGKVGLIIEDIAEDLGSTSKQETEVLLFGWGSSVGTVGA
jgi:hypothetical protein